MSRFITIFDPGASSQQIGAVLQAIDGAQGQLTQAWGESVLIVEGDAATQAATAGLDGVALVSDGAIPGVELLDIDADALDMARAWNVGQSEEYQAAVAHFLNLDLTAADLLAPNGCNDGTSQPLDILDLMAEVPIVPSLFGFALGGAAAVSPVYPNRRALVNTIGVAVIQIDGPDVTDASFTSSDWATALIGLSHGFDGLTNAAPRQAHLVFAPRVHHVKLTVNPATVPRPADPARPKPSEYEAAEAVWRDPALTALGATTGRPGYRDVVHKTRFPFNVDWGYVIVITKYRPAWPAYTPDYRDVVVSYTMVRDAPGIGVGQLPYVFAHETGHTVGALDEYAASNCSLLQKCGFSNQVNGNCAILNPFSVNCIMKQTPTPTFTPCFFTLSHFGWADQDSDGVLDPFDPSFVFF